MPLALVAIMTVVVVTARAEVIETSDAGFLVKNEALIKGTPVEIYGALTGRIDRWWDSAHTFSGDSSNLSLDPRPGGCFCERLPNNGGVTHLTVVFAAPGKELRLTGALGPLQPDGLAGSMSWTLSEAGGSTKVELRYSVGGYRSGGLRGLASPVDGVLNGQLQRLKKYVETGQPE